MKKITLGVIREGKIPPDFRVPLTPNQCVLVQEKFPHVQIIVQESPIRCFKDEAYREKGIVVQENMENCDILMGVKEVKINDLIPNKHYFFFSHTIKKQPYNRDLLRDILAKNIVLTDYEVIKNKIGKRLIGFGRYAGIVGCYNGFRAYGLKTGLYSLKRATDCADRIEVEQELKKVQLPKNTKIVLTGFGRVGYGAREILDLLPIMEVTPQEFLSKDFEQAVFTHMEVEDYFARIDGNDFNKADFYQNPEKYKSVFPAFAKHADMYVACHYWSNKSPFIITREDFKNPESRLKVVADVSCDIDGPIACTLRPSTIANPIYGYDPSSETEVNFMDENAVAVMAVDNLPCELPKDASEDFGNELLKSVFPYLFGEDPDAVIVRATETTSDGKLTDLYQYLADYVGQTTEK
jgi:saccharopine dehydrogenase (NAD+, L-lysine-forming)